MTTSAIKVPPLPNAAVITGGRGCGKSTLLEKLARRYGSGGGAAAGILARGLWKDGRREGFDLVDLTSGQATPLAQRRCEAGPGIPFDFFPEGLAAGARALDPARCAGAGLVAVDEVGPLELAGSGWAPYLSALLTLDRPLHLWVVRSNELARVLHCWPLRPQRIVAPDNPQALDGLLRLLERKDARES